MPFPTHFGVDPYMAKYGKKRKPGVIQYGPHREVDPEDPSFEAMRKLYGEAKPAADPNAVPGPWAADLPPASLSGGGSVGLWNRMMGDALRKTGGDEKAAWHEVMKQSDIGAKPAEYGDSFGPKRPSQAATGPADLPPARLSGGGSVELWGRMMGDALRKTGDETAAWQEVMRQSDIGAKPEEYGTSGGSYDPDPERLPMPSVWSGTGTGATGGDPKAWTGTGTGKGGGADPSWDAFRRAVSFQAQPGSPAMQALASTSVGGGAGIPQPPPPIEDYPAMGPNPPRETPRDQMEQTLQMSQDWPRRERAPMPAEVRPEKLEVPPREQPLAPIPGLGGALNAAGSLANKLVSPLGIPLPQPQPPDFGAALNEAGNFLKNPNVNVPGVGPVSVNPFQAGLTAPVPQPRGPLQGPPAPAHTMTIQNGGQVSQHQYGKNPDGSPAGLLSPSGYSMENDPILKRQRENQDLEAYLATVVPYGLGAAGGITHDQNQKIMENYLQQRALASQAYTARKGHEQAAKIHADAEVLKNKELTPYQQATLDDAQKRLALDERRLKIDEQKANEGGPRKEADDFYRRRRFELIKGGNDPVKAHTMALEEARDYFGMSNYKGPGDTAQPTTPTPGAAGAVPQPGGTPAAPAPVPQPGGKTHTYLDQEVVNKLASGVSSKPGELNLENLIGVLKDPEGTLKSYSGANEQLMRRIAAQYGDADKLRQALARELAINMMKSGAVEQGPWKLEEMNDTRGVLDAFRKRGVKSFIPFLPGAYKLVGPGGQAIAYPAREMPELAAIGGGVFNVDRSNESARVPLLIQALAGLGVR